MRYHRNRAEALDIKQIKPADNQISRNYKSGKEKPVKVERTELGLKVFTGVAKTTNLAFFLGHKKYYSPWLQLSSLRKMDTKKAESICFQPRCEYGGPWAIRTPDQLIKSQLLYRLS